jgi:hypothetical protein
VNEKELNFAVLTFMVIPAAQRFLNTAPEGVFFKREFAPTRRVCAYASFKKLASEK